MKMLSIAVVLAALAVPALVQPTGAAAKQYGWMAAKMSTQQFVERAAISNIFEIQSGQLAQQNAASSEVRRFGETMARDHQKMRDELQSLVNDMPGGARAEIPQHLDEKHAKRLERLKSTTGAAFDRAYMNSQIKGHLTAIAIFESYAKHGDNAELKAWAERTLPPLREHFWKARAIRRDISAAKSAAN